MTSQKADYILINLVLRRS